MLRRLTPILLFAGSAATGLTPVADGDVFWHLAAGREMARTGSVLDRDLFSSAAAGRAWIDVHWLFQRGAYAVHALGGLRALVLCKCLLIGVSALVLYAALERRARPLYALIAVSALFCARHLLLVRPVIVSLLLLSLFFLLLERFRRERRWLLLVPLPLLQIVWSNCQGLFALGPALVAAYAAAVVAERALGQYGWYPFAREGGTGSRGPAPASHLHALLLAAGACLLCTLATPYGLRAWALPAELLSRLLPHAANPYAQVAENVPPFVLERDVPGQFWHLPWFLGLLALAFGLSGGTAPALTPSGIAERVRGGAAMRRGVLLSHALLVAGFVALALIANRNVLLLYFMAAPIAARQLTPEVTRALFALRRSRARWVLRGITGGAVLVLALAVGTAAAREPRLDQPTPFRFPQEAAARLARSADSGAVFAADHQGGYLIWALYPKFKPYIDTRLVLRSADEYSEYLELLDNPYRFNAFARREGISHVVLPLAYPDRYLRLIAQLYQSAEWKLVFTNGAEVLFTRSERTSEPACDLDTDATTDRLLHAMNARFAGDARLLEAARLQLASLQIAIGAFGQAERSLAGTSSPAALALRARACMASGALPRARALTERLLRMEPDDPRGLTLLAQLHARSGRSAEALASLRRALAADPFDREATRLLAALEESQNGP